MVQHSVILLALLLTLPDLVDLLGGAHVVDKAGDEVLGGGLGAEISHGRADSRR